MKKTTASEGHGDGTTPSGEVMVHAPSRGMGSPEVASFWDASTGSWQHVVGDPVGGEAAVVDPVWGFDPVSGAFDTEQMDRMERWVRDRGWRVVWSIDTHPHADHVSAAALWAERWGAKQVIGARVGAIQKIWAGIYGDDALLGMAASGAPWWDRLVEPGDRLALGGMEMVALPGWGHTLGSITWRVGDAVFAHDTLMMPDSGTARADFPGGSSSDLWDSVRAILDGHPGSTRVFVGHDYAPNGRGPLCMASVGEHRARNVHARDGVAREAFLALRDARDASLPLPRLMLLALQVNLRGGRLPDADAEGRVSLRLPVGRFPNLLAQRA